MSSIECICYKLFADPKAKVTSSDQTQKISVSCEGLPVGWKEIRTETQFPVPPGEEVSLKCSSGHTLTGDNTVTCLEGTNFKLNDAPTCVKGLSSKSENFWRDWFLVIDYEWHLQ